MTWKWCEGEKLKLNLLSYCTWEFRCVLTTAFKQLHNKDQIVLVLKLSFLFSSCKCWLLELQMYLWLIDVWEHKAQHTYSLTLVLLLDSISLSVWFLILKLPTVKLDQNQVLCVGLGLRTSREAQGCAEVLVPSCTNWSSCWQSPTGAVECTDP